MDSLINLPAGQYFISTEDPAALKQTISELTDTLRRVEGERDKAQRAFTFRDKNIRDFQSRIRMCHNELNRLDGTEHLEYPFEKRVKAVVDNFNHVYAENLAHQDKIAELNRRIGNQANTILTLQGEVAQLRQIGAPFPPTIEKLENEVAKLKEQHNEHVKQVESLRAEVTSYRNSEGRLLDRLKEMRSVFNTARVTLGVKFVPNQSIEELAKLVANEAQKQVESLQNEVERYDSLVQQLFVVFRIHELAGSGMTQRVVQAQRERIEKTLELLNNDE